MENLTGRKFDVRLARFCVTVLLVAGALMLYGDKCVSSGQAEVESKSVPTGERFGEIEWDDFRVYGEGVLNETLEAYNKGNYEDFVKNFSRKRRAITQRAFEALWEGDYKGKYGNFISKEFFKEKSNSVKNFPLLTYKAVFAKNGEIGIRCVFTQDDDGVYRIFYLRFDPYQDLFY